MRFNYNNSIKPVLFNRVRADYLT